MKRKRGSAKRTAKKESKAAGASVDPGYYSDENENNDGNDHMNESNEANAIPSSQQLDLEKPVVNNGTFGSAAAKLAWALSTSHTDAAHDRVSQPHPRIGLKEPKSSLKDPLYNKQELDAAQSVIKKIMQMDAAEPFNAPVDPIALGIPDYFDIIDTPMDFGTISSKLEKGLEYKNSKDVFKDVQQIWENCIKYNKKGSYIVELMKRVKTNFMKQWTAAGLYKEQETASNGNLPRSPPLIDSTTRDEETPNVYPGGSAMKSSAYMQPHDSHFLNQSQHPPPSPYYPPPFNPQHLPYQWPGPYHPGMPPPYSYLTPHLTDHMNGNYSNQRLNEVSPSIMHSYQPSPSYSHMGPPHHGTWMHPPSSSHMAPSGLQSDRNDQTPGHLLVPHKDSTSTLNKHEHAFNSVGNAGGHQPKHHPVNSIHTPTHHPSTSHIPEQQLNLSTHHQSQNPRTEVGRYTDYAGNRHTPPPTESAVNCIKRGADTGPPQGTENTSFQKPPAQINSTSEQSSSMENIEACHETTADNNFSGRKTRVQGVIDYREHSSSSRNSRESQPLDNTSQNQIGPPEPRPSLPYYNKKPTKKRGRGPTKELQLTEGVRLSVTINDQGQPVGIEAQKLVTYLGTLARNGNYLPLTYLDWRAVPIEKKESMWEKVQANFEIDPVGKDWVIHNLGIRWKDWKSKLKTAHYYPHKTDEERLADCDERVIPEQWAALVALWSTEEHQKKSARNRANRLKSKYNHATGSKSFARLREEQRAKRPDGKELSRAELFVLTRTKKNGEPVNEETLKIITQLQDLENDPDTPNNGNKPADVLAEIIGSDKKGRPRCIELGPTPDMPKAARLEAIKIASEAKTEIKEMKEKMAAMEQACSQMASQMASMMSMMVAMQKAVGDKNLAIIDTNAPGASGHSFPPQDLAMPSPSVGSTRQTRRSSKRLL